MCSQEDSANQFLPGTCFSFATSDTSLHPLLSSRINHSSNIHLRGGILYTLIVCKVLPLPKTYSKQCFASQGGEGSVLTQYLYCLCCQYCRQHPQLVIMCDTALLTKKSQKIFSAGLTVRCPVSNLWRQLGMPTHSVELSSLLPFLHLFTRIHLAKRKITCLLHLVFQRTSGF